MTGEQKKLEDLVVSEEDLNKSLLREVLLEYIRITDETGQIITQPEFQDLKAKEKILLILLAQKALEELGKAEKDYLSPSEMSEKSEIKKGTIYPLVRELEEEGIAENNDGEYKIPSYNIERVKQVLNQEEGEE